MKKTITDSQLRQIVKESIKNVLNEGFGPLGPSFENLLRELTSIVCGLSNFGKSIPREQGMEFMRLVGREWNDLLDSLSALERKVSRINKQGNVTVDDLS